MSRPFEDLRQHTAALRRLARDLVGEGAADDVLQDAAVVALRGDAPVGDAARGWWFGVVRNLAGKWRRTEATRRRHEANAAREEVHFERSVEAADSLRWLTAELTTLPEPYRGALLARYVRDLTPTEIAAETGEPVRTVKTRLQRGLGLLRERFEARGGDWRAGLVAAFGLEHAAAKVAATTAGAMGGAVVTWIGGAMLMNTTAKVVVVAAATLALAAGLWWWQPWRADVEMQQRASRDVAAAEAVDGQAAREPATSPPSADEAPVQVERQVVAGAGDREAQPVAADAIVVVVRDADDGAPIVDFGLRRHRMANREILFASETPLVFAGEHDGGRLLLPIAELGRDNFVVEAAAGSYLPSRWFDAADVHEVDGERRVEVALPKPVEQVVRVVLEGASTPVAGAVVELLRAWPGHEPVTLRTNVQPSDKLRAQADEQPMAVAFLGGRALLLQRATTDVDGRVTLRVPPGEDLALRLLGPGHQPRVETPWRVERGDVAVERVVAVRTGAAIEFRAFPPEALRALQLPPLPDEWRDRMGNIEALQASFTVGVWLRNPATKETRPSQQGFLIPPIPFGADGRLRIDGVEPGDWEPNFVYPLRCGPEQQHPYGGYGACRVQLPTVTALQPNELRIVDLDLAGYLPGTLQATVVFDGQAPEGGVTFAPIASTGVPLPQFNTSTLVVDAEGRVEATLPPARYLATWRTRVAFGSVPLGEFTSEAAQPTVHTFVVDVVAVQVRVLDADGRAAPAGSVLLERPGLRTSGETDDTGLAVVPEQLRGDTVRVSYCPRIGELPNGRASFGPPVPLGELTAGAATEPVTLRLPKP